MNARRLGWSFYEGGSNRMPKMFIVYKRSVSRRRRRRRRRKSFAPRRWVPVEPVTAPTNTFTFLSLPWHVSRPIFPSVFSLATYLSNVQFSLFFSFYRSPSLSLSLSLFLSRLHLDPSRHRWHTYTSNHLPLSLFLPFPHPTPCSSRIAYTHARTHTHIHVQRRGTACQSFKPSSQRIRI